jgi:cell division protein FtsI (penicillin-binding protein 3)
MAFAFPDPEDEYQKGGAGEALLGRAKTRLGLAALLFMLGYFAVCLRLVDLTLLQARSSAEEAREQDVKPLGRPLRADIVDRTGAQVATSLKMASVYADAALVEDPGRLADALARILPGESRADLFDKLSSRKKFVWLKRDVTPQQEYAINALGSPALNFQEEERRIYPGGNLAAHVAGYTDLDGGGISGIEKSFDAALRRGGAPVQLTLDMRLQHVMRRALEDSVRKFEAKAGVGLVMDVNTGEILSLVSLPDFDPHHPGDAKDDARFNRGALGVFEMGSTFKMFSIAAALDAGTVHLGSTFDAGKPITYGRFTISDYHAQNRPMTVPEIFMYSSNIGAARIAQTLGDNGLKEFYRKLGFFASAPIELPERGQPLYPRPWRDIDTLTTSFGHGIAVSPVHLARAAAALVNGGILVAPTLVRGDRPLSLTPQGERVISPRTSAAMRDLLELVVAAGTGEKAYVEGYGVGGKTGTAEKNQNGHYIHNRVLSSFLGVYPIRDPRYVVLAMLDEPQPIKETKGYVTGGWTAAPVVGTVVAEMAPLYGIPPVLGDGHDIVKDMAMYLKDAKEGKHLASLGTER